MKKLLIYGIELIVAAILMWIDQRLFWLYFFIITMYLIDSRTDYLRKIIRVFQVFNETKIMTIMKKLNISEEEIKKTLEKTKESLSAEKWESLERDFKDITND